MSKRALVWIRVGWIAATFALTAVWRAEALVLLVPLAVLGPLVREVAPPVDEDERERMVDYRASHVALMTMYALLFLLFARAQVVEGTGLPEDLVLLFAAPLTVRAGLSIGRATGARRAGLVMGFTVGACWLAFALLSHGVSIEAAIGGGMLVATALALRWPRAGGSMLVALGVLFLGAFAWPRLGRADWRSGLAMMSILAAPPIIAGLALWASAVRSAQATADEFADLRREGNEGP